MVSENLSLCLWMDDYTVSTGELKAAARKLPMLIVSQEDPDTESDQTAAERTEVVEATSVTEHNSTDFSISHDSNWKSNDSTSNLYKEKELLSQDNLVNNTSQKNNSEDLVSFVSHRSNTSIVNSASLLNEGGISDKHSKPEIRVIVSEPMNEDMLLKKQLKLQDKEYKQEHTYMQSKEVSSRESHQAHLLPEVRKELDNVHRQEHPPLHKEKLFLLNSDHDLQYRHHNKTTEISGTRFESILPNIQSESSPINKLSMLGSPSKSNSIGYYNAPLAADKKSNSSESLKLPPMVKSPAKNTNSISLHNPQGASVVRFGGNTLPTQLWASSERHNQSYSEPQSLGMGKKSHSYNIKRDMHQMERLHPSKSRHGSLGTGLQKVENLLQLSPSSGGAMSYATAMSQSYSVNSDESKFEDQDQKKNSYLHRKKFSPSPTDNIRRRHSDQKASRVVFRKTERTKPVLDNLHVALQQQSDENNASEEEDLDESLKEELVEDTTIDRKERRGLIHRQVTRLEIEEQLACDDSYLVKFSADEKMKRLVHKLRGGVINSLDHLTDSMIDDYDNFLTQMDTVTYYALRQSEEVLEGYSPQIAVVISSSVPNSHTLKDAAKPGVLTMVYDNGAETYSTLYDKILDLVNGYMSGARMKRLAIVCKGGPGYMYLLKRKPITPPKLLKDDDLLRFWKNLGRLMSKILEESSVVHLMESNVAGNRQGEELLMDFEAAMFAHKVNVESPLEISHNGKEMIETYFIPDKFRAWKNSRYPRHRLL